MIRIVDPFDAFLRSDPMIETEIPKIFTIESLQANKLDNVGRYKPRAVRAIAISQVGKFRNSREPRAVTAIKPS